MAQEERISWVSLLVTLVVAWVYFAQALRLPAEHAVSRSGFLLTDAIIVAVFVGIFSEAALRLVQRRRGEDADAAGSLRDERDAIIGLRSARNGYVVLMVAVAGVLGFIAIAESGGWQAAHPVSPQPGTVWNALAQGLAPPAVVAQLLLAAFSLTGIAVYASRVWYYRRGF